VGRRGREKKALFLSEVSNILAGGGHEQGPPVIHDPVDQLEGKPMKEITASSVYKQRPAFGSKRDGFDAAVKFGQKRIRSRLASGLIPLPSSLGFLNGGGMKNIR
jgi:hypothetical protein